MTMRNPRQGKLVEHQRQAELCRFCMQTATILAHFSHSSQAAANASRPPRTAASIRASASMPAGVDAS